MYYGKYKCTIVSNMYYGKYTCTIVSNMNYGKYICTMVSTYVLTAATNKSINCLLITKTCYNQSTIRIQLLPLQLHTSKSKNCNNWLVHLIPT